MTTTTAVRVPLCPQGCVQQDPMGPGELVRWHWRSSGGASVTVALMVRDGAPWVQWWTGPSSFHVETANAEEVWELVEVMAVVAAWLAGPPEPAPAPAGQPSLFDEVPAVVGDACPDDPDGLHHIVAPMHDEHPLGVFGPGRWAWLLEHIRPTTERCPACWGLMPDGTPISEVSYYRGREACPMCDGFGHCDPIPAKGRQGLWRWTPEVTGA